MPKITVFRKNVTRKRKLLEFTNVENTRECNDPQQKRSYFSRKIVSYLIGKNARGKRDE
jgi:hypothetical protein